MTVAFVAAVHESLTGTNQANRVGLTMSVDRVDDHRRKVKTLPVVPSSQVGIGMLGVALAFGLTVLTMAYAIGHVSGCHLNPAVTVGLTFGGRFPPGLVLPYVVAQVVGAIVGAAVLYAIASGSPDFALAGGFAANGYADHSPGKYGLGACLLSEVVLTMMFLFVIMGATHGKAPTGFAPIAIGLALPLFI